MNEKTTHDQHGKLYMREKIYGCADIDARLVIYVINLWAGYYERERIERFLFN